MSAALVHVGYILMLCALVVAQTILGVYAWSVGIQAIAAWNVLFVLINLTWVVKILRERRAVAVPDDLRPLYDEHFFALSPAEFLRWPAAGLRALRERDQAFWARIQSAIGHDLVLKVQRGEPRRWP